MDIGGCRTILHRPIIAQCMIIKDNRTQRKARISPDLPFEFARKLQRLRFRIFGIGIYGPFPIFRGPAERVYPQTVPCSFVSRLRYKQFPKLFVPPRLWPRILVSRLGIKQPSGCFIFPNARCLHYTVRWCGQMRKILLLRC